MNNRGLLKEILKKILFLSSTEINSYSKMIHYKTKADDEDEYKNEYG
jgi:hypothetical protein